MELGDVRADLQHQIDAFLDHGRIEAVRLFAQVEPVSYTHLTLPTSDLV